MRVSKPTVAFICVLISALLVRAAISATMPISMLGNIPSVLAIEKPAATHDDCPGHATAKAGINAGAEPASCAWCGECCVSAPVFAFNPDQNIAKNAQHAVFARVTIRRFVYLTPGLYRPPAV